MPIKARPFKTTINEVEVEGFIEDESFVFRFYGLPTYRAPILSVGEDAFGKFAILQETEISDSDGFVFAVEQNYDADLASEWGYLVSLKRNDSGDRDFLNSLLEAKGIEPTAVNLLIPSRQLISVYFNPRGVQDGSAHLGSTEEFQSDAVLNKVQSAGAKRILFLSHAVRQMSRPDRMLSTVEVQNVIAEGEVIEDYPDDPRGPSCLLLAYGEEGRPIHVVCSPKEDFLAIITAYLPNPSDWSADFRQRLNR